MKKSLGLLLVLLLLTACQNRSEVVTVVKEESQSSQSTSQSTSQSIQKSETAVSESSTSSSSSSSSSVKEAYTQEVATATALWNADKAQQLASFMVSWGNEMNQPGYKSEGIDEWLSFNFFMNDSYDISVEKSLDGTGNSDYNIVAVYSYVYGANSIHRYFFTFNRSGQPVVLYSAQNQGGMPHNRLYVKQTQNQELSAGFANIANQ